MKFCFACKCGAVWEGRMSGPKWSRQVADLNLEFTRQHDGPGHELCDRATALKARRRNERKEVCEARA